MAPVIFATPDFGAGAGAILILWGCLAILPAIVTFCICSFANSKWNRGFLWDTDPVVSSLATGVLCAFLVPVFCQTGICRVGGENERLWPFLLIFLVPIGVGWFLHRRATKK